MTKISIIQDFIPRTLPTRSGIRITPQFITIHNTDNANRGAGAAAHNAYIRGSHAVGRKVSWHYSVDDKQVFQHLPTNERGLHAGTTDGNNRSIGIEICMNSDMDTTKAYRQAAALVAHCVASLSLPFPGCMKQHNNWSGKNCPSLIRAGRPMSWNDFLSLCREEITARASGRESAELQPEITEEQPEWKTEDRDAILESIESSMADHGGEEEEGGTPEQ
jgi:N-acetylmuramoyl-L-alanine amidase CwlA